MSVKPIESRIHSTNQMLVMERLKSQVNAAMAILESDMLIDMTAAEIASFKQNHPNVDFIIGDFEIRCLNLDPL